MSCLRKPPPSPRDPATLAVPTTGNDGNDESSEEESSEEEKEPLDASMSKEDAARMEAAVGHFQGRMQSNAWNTWFTRHTERATMLRGFHLALSRMTHRGMLRGWLAWQANHLDRKAATAAMSMALRQMQRQALAHAWRAWSSSRLECATRLQPMQRALQHILQRRLATGWRMWESNAQSILAVRGAVSHFVRRAQSSGWVTWKHSHAERADSLREVRKAVGYFSNASAARCLKRWRGVCERARLRARWRRLIRQSARPCLVGLLVAIALWILLQVILPQPPPPPPPPPPALPTFVRMPILPAHGAPTLVLPRYWLLPMFLTVIGCVVFGMRTRATGSFQSNDSSQDVSANGTAVTPAWYDVLERTMQTPKGRSVATRADASTSPRRPPALTYGSDGQMQVPSCSIPLSSPVSASQGGRQVHLAASPRQPRSGNVLVDLPRRGTPRSMH